MDDQLQELKHQLEKVLDKLDALVRLEEQHNNTVESLKRAHGRIDTNETRIAKLESQVQTNSMFTRALERLGWIGVSAVVSFLAWYLK